MYLFHKNRLSRFREIFFFIFLFPSITPTKLQFQGYPLVKFYLT